MTKLTTLPVAPRDYPLRMMFIALYPAIVFSAPFDRSEPLAVRRRYEMAYV